MTRSEEIKEARHEWYLRTQDADFCAGFQKGAEWADAHPDIDVRTMAAWQSGYNEGIAKSRWISVEDELPPKKSEYDDLSNNVLATDGKEIYESVYNHDFEDWFTHDMWGLSNITYWMPMPSIEHLKDK